MSKDFAKSLAQKTTHAKVQAQETQHWSKNPSQELQIQYNIIILEQQFMEKLHGLVVSTCLLWLQHVTPLTYSAWQASDLTKHSWIRTMSGRSGSPEPVRPDKVPEVPECSYLEPGATYDLDIYRGY